MNVRKNAKTVPERAATQALPELFGSDIDGERVSFADIDWNAFGRLATLCTGRGARVAIYISSDSNTLCISVGVGEQFKRYQADDAEQFDSIVEGVAQRFGAKRVIPPGGKKTS